MNVIFFCLLVIHFMKGSFCFDDFPGSDYEDLVLYDGSDFLISATSSLFVDKTLLMKCFIDVTKRGSGLLVLAPSKYGKTTNLNMMKRFFSLSVDEEGNVQERNETSNYLLFKSNNLEIYQNRNYFNEHFANYPVISVDFSPLAEVSSVNDFEIIIRTIIVETYVHHLYLKDDISLWTFDKNTSYCPSKGKIHSYFELELSDRLGKYDIQVGFSILAKLLSKKFKKRVIVLIDNYNAILDSKLFVYNSTFISSVLGDLYSNFLCCESVERSFISGTRRQSRPFLDVLPSCVVDSGAAGGVWRYYGLSDRELDMLLRPYIRNYGHRGRVCRDIVQVSAVARGKSVNNTQPCSVWALIQFLVDRGVKTNCDYEEYTLD